MFIYKDFVRSLKFLMQSNCVKKKKFKFSIPKIFIKCSVFYVGLASYRKHIAELILDKIRKINQL